MSTHNTKDNERVCIYIIQLRVISVRLQVEIITIYSCENVLLSYILQSITYFKVIKHEQLKKIIQWTLLNYIIINQSE